MRNFQLAFQGPFMAQTVSQWSLRTKVWVRYKASACGTSRHTSAVPVGISPLLLLAFRR